MYFAYDWYCTYLIGGNHTANWLTTTGWSLLSMYTYPVTYSGGQAYILAHGYSFYENTGFPLCTGTVNASVYDNRIDGDSQGNAYMSYDASVSGPACTYLLSLFVDQTNSF